MAKAKIKLYMQRTGSRERELVSQTVIEDANVKTSVWWIRSIVHRYFEEFVIGDSLILLSRTPSGYSVRRSCLPIAPDYFAWMYLEIMPVVKDVVSH